MIQTKKNLENKWDLSLNTLLKKIDFFFLEPASSRPLAVLRIALGVLLLVQAYYLRTSVFDLFSSNGWIQGPLAQYLSIPNTPRISWFVTLLSPLGVSEVGCIYLLCLAYLVSVFSFCIGFKTRVASILTWFFHWVFMNTGYSTAYGIDLYAHVFLFYLMWMPCGEILSIDSLIKNQPPQASSTARLSLRVLQLHLCISYLTSGIAKAKGIQWWNGELLWRAYSLPVYHQFDMSWLASWPFLSKLGCWLTLLLEGGYFIFIWPKKTRYLWIAGMISLHLGIAIFLGLGLFGMIMCILTFSVFGVSARPHPNLIAQPDLELGYTSYVAEEAK